MAEWVKDVTIDKFEVATLKWLKEISGENYQDIWIPIPSDVGHAMVAYYVRKSHLSTRPSGDDRSVVADKRLMVLFERMMEGLVKVNACVDTEMREYRARISGAESTTFADAFGAEGFDTLLYFPICVNMSDMERTCAGQPPPNVSAKGNHWVLVVVDLGNREMFIYDSMNHDPTIQVLSSMLNEILDSSPFKMTVKFPYDKAPQKKFGMQRPTRVVQRESGLCGYYVMYIMEMIMRYEVERDEVHDSDQFTDETVRNDFMKRLRDRMQLYA